MDDAELRQRFDALDKKIGETFVLAEKTRKYILTITIITVVALVVPLIGMIVAIPAFISTYSQLGAF